MAVSSAGFVEVYPEFAQTVTTRPAYVAARLTAAAQHVDAVAWGDQYDWAVYTKAAHMCAMGPYGESARLNKFSEKTTYSVLFDEELSALPVRMLIV